MPNYCFSPTILLLKHQNIWLTLQKFFTCRILSIWTMSKNITIFFSSRFFIILLIPYCSSSSCMWRHLLAEIWWWAERPRHIKGCLHYRFSFSYFFSYFSFLFFLSFEQIFIPFSTKCGPSSFLSPSEFKWIVYFDSTHICPI